MALKNGRDLPKAVLAAASIDKALSTSDLDKVSDGLNPRQLPPIVRVKQ